MTLSVRTWPSLPSKGGVQLWSVCLAGTKSGFHPQHCMLGMVAHACGLRTQEIESGPSEVRGYSSLHRECEARLSYKGCYLKEEK